MADGEEGGKQEEEEEISVSYVIRRGSGASSGGGKNLGKSPPVDKDLESKEVEKNGSENKVEVEPAPEVEVEEEVAAAAAMVSEEERADVTAHEEDVEKTSAAENTFNLPAELLEEVPAESVPEEKAEEAAVHGTSDEEEAKKVQQDVAMPHDEIQVPRKENKENIAKGVFQEKEDKIEEQETKEKEKEEEDPSHMHEGKS